MKIRLEFKLQDCWVGVYWNRCFLIPEDYGYGWCRRWQWDVWICLVPMLPLHLTWTRREKASPFPSSSKRKS